jgi:hypothetical protein
LQEGVEAYGFDPVCIGENPRIYKRYFSKDILGKEAKGLILRHVLSQVQNPIEFLFQLQEANGGKGRIYIEVPCCDWVIKNRVWFDVCYEIINYFRLADFDRMFKDIIASGYLFGGQYLYVIAELSSLRWPTDLGERVAFPEDFTRSFEIFKGMPYKQASVYGAGNKGVMFSLMMEKWGRSVEMIIDDDPYKQGKFAAGTGIKIVSAREAWDLLPSGSTVFIMNPCYTTKIKDSSPSSYNFVVVNDFL